MNSIEKVESSDLVNEFLEKNGVSAQCVQIAGDWAQRQYFRIQKDADKTAILMKCLDQNNRDQMRPFVTIANHLRKYGFSTPEIYDVDYEQGFMLLEDLGTNDFDTIIKNNAKQNEELYHLAASVLKDVKRLIPDNEVQLLPDFFETAVGRGHIRAVNWYMPMIRSAGNRKGAASDFLKVWEEIESVLPEPEKGFVHIDFHPGNLVLLPSRKGKAKCGLLDFQGAAYGPAAYDYTNLLKDIRRDVPASIEEDVLQESMAGMGQEQKESFLSWYKFLSIQFHLRIIGQVVKLSLEEGRDDLLSFIPRVSHYLKKELEEPEFAPLKSFFEHEGVYFDDTIPNIDKKFILENTV